MDPTLAKRYQELADELKVLFQELAALQLENERLAKENITLREEVSLLRLYIDTYLQEGTAPKELGEVSLTPSTRTAEDLLATGGLTEDALAFYNQLPQSFNFSELFELAELLGVEKQQMKGFMTAYLRENLMQQHGTRVEKIGSLDPWQGSFGGAPETGGSNEA